MGGEAAQLLVAPELKTGFLNINYETVGSRNSRDKRLRRKDCIEVLHLYLEAHGMDKFLFSFLIIFGMGAQASDFWPKRMTTQLLTAQEIYGSPTDWANYDLDYTVVIVKDSGWEKNEVIERIKKTAQIYKQCGVSTSKVKIVEFDGSDSLKEIDQEGTGPFGYLRRVMYATSDLPKPQLFYVKKNLFRVLGIKVDISNSNWGDDVSSIKRGTAFLSHSVTEPSYLQIINNWGGTYHPDAHELCHIACHTDHDYQHPGGLMSFDQLTSYMNPELCQKLRNGPYTKVVR